MQPAASRITNAFQVGLLGGLGVMTALLIATAVATLANVITYVAAAIFIALGLDPFVRWLESRGLGRQLSVLIVVAAVISTLAVIVWTALPTLLEQVTDFVTNTPLVLSSLTELAWFQSLDQQFGGAATEALTQVGSYVSDSKNWALMLGGVVQVGLSIFNGFVGTLVVIVLSIYFMASLGVFKRWVHSLVPASKRESFIDVTDKIAAAIGRYVIGQATIASINSILAFVLMSILGTPYSVALAFVVFLLGLIPLLGTITGAVLVTLVSLTVSPTAALIAAIYYLIYMQVEAYLIAPRVMSKAVSVPGAIVVVAALAGGALLGVLGALIAIPAAASIILVLRQIVLPRQNIR